MAQNQITVTWVINALAGLTIPGIHTIRPNPPASVTTAQLPSMFFRTATIGNQEGLSLSNTGGLRKVNVEALILVEADRQSTQPFLYSKTREVMDNVAQALEAAAPSLRLDDYLIRETSEAIQTTSYFAVVVNMSFS